MAIRSLLVPVDFLLEGDRALPIAARLARVAHLPIELITVSSPWIDESSDVDELASRVEALRPLQATWSIVHDDDPAAAIVRAIAARPDALPVIGTGAPGPLTELVLGDVGEAVLAHSERPILFVGPNAELQVDRVERVMVAVSSWDGGEALLDAVADLVSVVPAAVEVVEVVDPEGAAIADAPDAESNLVRGMANALRRRNVPAQWDVLHDEEPLAGIVAAAADRKATILVAATTRWVTRQRVHPRSTVRRMVRDVEAAVLVVPRPE